MRIQAWNLTTNLTVTITNLTGTEQRFYQVVSYIPFEYTSPLTSPLAIVGSILGVGVGLSAFFLAACCL